MWAHIKEKGLQDPNDGRVIHCDAQLQSLLNPAQPTIHMIKDLPRLMAALLPSAKKAAAAAQQGSSSSGDGSWSGGSRFYHH